MTTVPNEKPREVERSIVPSLNQIYFYLTDGCNLACRHCWLAPKFDHDGTRHPTLQMELFETSISEAKALGLSRVKLTGGEPLLHPEFRRLLEIVRRQDLALTIETNGMLCTPEIAAEIAKSPRRFISVSMDGADTATHDWVRGVEGSFEKAQQAVRNLAAVDTPPQIIMSVMRCNADQIEAMVRLAERLGASSVKFNVVQPTGRGEVIQEGTNGLEVADVIELGLHVDTELCLSTKLRLVFDYPMAFRPLSRIASGNGNGVCGILGIIGVMANDQYALCGIGKHLPELVFGVVGRDPLEKVWRENGVLNALREGLPGQLGGICKTCLMKSRCLGSCIAQNYYRTGSLWSPFWFCEQAEEIGLFPKTRLDKQ
jgi:SynChlorMet cassette radical SAM/SPASM protein ScmF